MIDYNTILSTTDSKVTLMQWLQALTEEFENAQITDVTFTNDSNKSLTFTFKLEDGTTKTATIELHSLTADEQSLINNLIKSVTASSDGVTFSKAVSFQGNESHNGSEIHNGYASFLGDENHAGSEMHKGTATFTDLRSDDLTATDGQELVSWDGTTTALKGKATRPTYNGGDLALKSDVNAVSDVHFFVQTGDMKNYFYGHNNALNMKNLYVHFGDKITNANSMFRGTTFNSIDIDSVGTATDLACMFYAVRNATSISAFKMTKATDVREMFAWSQFITIPALDFSSVPAGSYHYNFSKGCTALTSFLATGIHFSFDLSESTNLDQAALRVVIDNLGDMTDTGKTATLTLGSTLLAKLTADDITTANNKGWNLA